MMKSTSSWAITLADLALILFIVTASNFSEAASLQQSDEDTNGVDAVPQAIYAPGPEAPPLSKWITDQDMGDGATVDVTLAYQPGQLGEALEQAKLISEQISNSGKAPRITLAPGEGDPRVVISYDN